MGELQLETRVDRMERECNEPNKKRPVARAL